MNVEHYRAELQNKLNSAGPDIRTSPFYSQAVALANDAIQQSSQLLATYEKQAPAGQTLKEFILNIDDDGDCCFTSWSLYEHLMPPNQVRDKANVVLQQPTVNVVVQNTLRDGYQLDVIEQQAAGEAPTAQ